MRTASVIINTVIFAVTLILMIRCFREAGQWKIGRGLKAFRYFTVLSNVLCALAALTMAAFQLRGAVPAAAVEFKYLGTVAVTVTLMTVLLFLGPSQGGYGDLLRGDNLYMHLLGPLLAIASYCFLEKREMTLAAAMTGLIPVLLYGAVYLYMVIYAPQSVRWEDFYGFNKGGNWPVSFGAMIAGTAVICALFRAI